MSSVTLKNALSGAMYLEQALIENKYFEIFEGDSAQIKHILGILADSTREHYQRIRKSRPALKSSGN